MILLYLILTSVLFLIFFVMFYCYGRVVGYNTKKEGAVKAFFFAVIVFLVYYAPRFPLEITASMVVPAATVMALLCFYVIYKHARTAPWRKTAKEKR